MKHRSLPQHTEAMTAPTEALRVQLAAKGVRYLFAQFSDIHGTPRGKIVPLEHIEALFNVGAGFAGPSIAGTGLPRAGVRAEYYGRGDPDGVTVIPWMPGYARVVCDGYVAGQPFALCPRQLLRKQVERLATHGFSLNAGIEPEFFLLQRADDGRLLPADEQDKLEKPSYDYKSLTRQIEFITDLVDTLRACDLDVFQIDHEDANSQFEINYRYAEALRAADDLMLFKMAAHSVAEEYGYIFSMMPKPFADRPGSGLHFHLSLNDAAGNAPFADTLDPAGHGLSKIGLAFMGGLLHHAPALTALCAPTVNSYKRLVIGESLSGSTWAPAHIGYGFNNRTTVARTVGGRIEWRLPDASANPYIALAGVIAAGLDGIERDLAAGTPIDDDLYELSPAELKRRGISTLPQSLREAVAALDADGVLREHLGNEFCDEFVRLKRMEWIEFSRVVHAWEVERYSDRF